MDQQVLDCPIKQVDYIILNEIEAAEICGLVRKIKDEQLARKLAESFPNTKVILTLGEKVPCIWKKETSSDRKAFMCQ